jgi:hypothetical protein
VKKLIDKLPLTLKTHLKDLYGDGFPSVFEELFLSDSREHIQYILELSKHWYQVSFAGRLIKNEIRDFVDENWPGLLLIDPVQIYITQDSSISNERAY